MKHTGQPIEVIGMILFSLDREEQAVVILQNVPFISNVDISTILILFLKPCTGSGEQQLSPSLENFYIQENLAGSCFKFILAIHEVLPGT